MIRKQVKMIGAGKCRTGTSTLKAAMEILGMKCYHMTEAHKLHDHPLLWSECFDNRPSGDVDSLLGKSGYEASCDFPSCVFFEEQMKAYPDAKVILTIRDPEKWYKSCCDTVFQHLPENDSCPIGFRMFILVWLPKGTAEFFDKCICQLFLQNQGFSKENCIRCFNEHNEYVKRVVPPGKLLVVDITSGEMSWKKLCEFLEVPIPNVPFPRLNDTKEMQRVTLVINIIGWIIGFLGLGIPFLFIPLKKKSGAQNSAVNAVKKLD